MTLERRFVLLSALRWLPLGVVLPLLVLVPTARGLDLAEIGLVTATHGIVAVVLEVPSGALADTIGRRRTLIAGGLLTVAALAVFAFAVSLPAFVVAEGTLAAGRALISGALEAWFVDALRAGDADAPLGPALSRSSAASALALALGSLAGGALPLLPLGLDAHGAATALVYTPAVLVAAGCAALFVVVTGVLVSEPPRPAAAAQASPGPRAALARVARSAATAVRASQAVRVLAGVSAVLGLVFGTVEMLWQPRLGDLLDGAADDTWLFGLLSAAALGAAAAGAIAVPRATRRLGSPRHAYAAAVLLGALVLTGLALAAGPAAFALAYVAAYGVVGAYEPLHNELLHEAVPSQVRATLVSVDALAAQLGLVAGGLTLAPLAQAHGVPAAWLVGAGVLAACTALVLRLPRAPAEAAVTEAA